MPQTVDPNTPLSPTSVGSLNLPLKNTAGPQTGATVNVGGGVTQPEGTSTTPAVDPAQNLWVNVGASPVIAAGNAQLVGYFVQLTSQLRVTNKLLSILVKQQTEIPDDAGLDAIWEDDVVN